MFDSTSPLAPSWLLETGHFEEASRDKIRPARFVISLPPSWVQPSSCTAHAHPSPATRNPQPAGSVHTRGSGGSSRDCRRKQPGTSRGPEHLAPFDVGKSFSLISCKSMLRPHLEQSLTALARQPGRLAISKGPDWLCTGPDPLCYAPGHATCLFSA